jgi:hypothetical protein
MPDSWTGSRPAGGPARRPRQEERYAAFAKRLPVGRTGHAEDFALGAMHLMANGYGQEVMD